MQIAIYPGTFDPVTKGHEDIIRRAVKLCDVLYVAVAHGHHKNTCFSLQERLNMMEHVIADIRLTCNNRICPVAFDGLLADICRKLQVGVIIRGIRCTADYEYEHRLAEMNKRLLPEAETIFLNTDYRYHFISSGLIKETARLGGDVSQWVHPFINKNLTGKNCTKS